MGGAGLDEWDSEREGEEFPRLHACSTVDRPLERHGREHGPRKVALSARAFGYFRLKLMACTNCGPGLPFHANHVAAEGGVAMTRPTVSMRSLRYTPPSLPQ